MQYMATFTINIPQMLAYTTYMDRMGNVNPGLIFITPPEVFVFFHWGDTREKDQIFSDFFLGAAPS